jgi:hypothetical protein
MIEIDLSKDSIKNKKYFCYFFSFQGNRHFFNFTLRKIQRYVAVVVHNDLPNQAFRVEVGSDVWPYFWLSIADLK